MRVTPSRSRTNAAGQRAASWAMPLMGGRSRLSAGYPHVGAGGQRVGQFRFLATTARSGPCGHGDVTRFPPGMRSGPGVSAGHAREVGSSCTKPLKSGSYLGRCEMSAGESCSACQVEVDPFPKDWRYSIVCRFRTVGTSSAPGGCWWATPRTAQVRRRRFHPQRLPARWWGSPLRPFRTGSSVMESPSTSSMGSWIRPWVPFPVQHTVTR